MTTRKDVGENKKSSTSSDTLKHDTETYVYDTLVMLVRQ